MTASAETGFSSPAPRPNSRPHPASHRNSHEEAASAVRAGLKAHAAEMADPARSLGDLAGLAAVTVS